MTSCTPSSSRAVQIEPGLQPQFSKKGNFSACPLETFGNFGSERPKKGLEMAANSEKVRNQPAFLQF
jgi:hypothetical protein